MHGADSVVLRRLTGWIWVATWCGLLWLAHAPWLELGGVVSERLRWMERAVLGAGLLLGWLVGDSARHAARRREGWSHARLLGPLWVPPGMLVAAALVVLRLRGAWAPIGVVTNAWLAYWAGLDIALAAWPLVAGRRYRFRGVLAHDDPPARSTVNRGSGD